MLWIIRYRLIRALLIILIISSCFDFSVAQKELSPQEKSKIETSFKKARSLQRKGENKKAIKIYNRILKKDPEHIKSYLQLAGINYRINRSKAIDLIKKAISIDSFFDPEMYFSLALIYEKEKKRELAITNYSHYLRFEKRNEEKLSQAQKKIQQLKFILKSMADPQEFEPIDLGSGINTPSLEYLASVNIANDYMIFTRRINRQEDLYYSQKVNGIWTEAIAIKELNTGGNEGAHCLSPDGQTLIFTSCERRDSEGSCDLYISQLESNGWSKAENMGPVINSKYWDSQPSLSRDGNQLFFSSTRPGGVGGKDLWCSKKSEKGNWSSPFNLGNKVNSKGNEESPFIHPNDLNLYFMSDGHMGMGGYDLFVSEYFQGKWMDPRNLGYPINTEEDEGAIRVNADGARAFFSTDRKDISQKEKKDLDIYQFQLPEIARALPVGYLKGSISDRQSGAWIVDAEITLMDNHSKKEIARLRSDHGGRFLVTLPIGYDYNVNIQKEGYVYYSEHFDLKNENEKNKEFEISVLLEKILKFPDDEIQKSSQNFVMKNLFFKSGSFKIDMQRSAIELGHLLELLQNNPNLEVSIHGHTDNVGNERDNMELSIKRAEAVYLYLVDKGIDKQRLSFRGFGEKQAVASNDSEEGRSLNRRTEFIIINN